MKIVNIILTSQNGGAEQAFIDYLSALKNLGHDNLAILKEDAPYANKVEELGIPVKKITNKFGYHDFFAVNNIKKIVEETAADLVVSHANRPNVLVKKALKKIKSKKVHQIAVNHSSNVKRSIGADIVISVNSKIMAKTVDLGQSYERSFVVQNAIDLNSVVLDPEINFQKNKIVIGALGRLDRTKGFDLLIKAISELKKFTDKQFILKLAGAGYFEQDLKKLVKDLGVEDRVEFIGWISDKGKFFSEMDIFCIPSKNEAFGIVVLEAMKYGKPIVATSADGPMEILSNEKDSIIVNLQPEEDVVLNLAKAFIKIASDESLASNLVKNATEKLIRKYSYKALEEKLGEIIGRSKL